MPTPSLGIDGSGGDACVRLVHAAPAAPPVDVYLSEAQLAQDLAFATAKEYVAVPSGTGRGAQVTAAGAPIEARPGGEDMTIALHSDATLDVGTTYDLVLLGRPDDEALILLALTVPVATQTGAVATPETASPEAQDAETVVPATIEDAATPTG